MEEQGRKPTKSSILNRRQFLRTALATSSVAMVAAAVPGAAFASPRQVAAGQAAGLKQVPRNQTLVTVRGGTQGKFIEDQLWNPFIATANHQLGSQFLCEPLAFYSAYQDKMTMWLAESYQYSPDYMTLTIKTRKEAMWSDGVPFTADDVAYTYNSLNTLGSKVKWGADVNQVLDKASVVDPHTVQLKFKSPAPRFFEYSAYKYDIGIYMMPKHIFEKQTDIPPSLTSTCPKIGRSRPAPGKWSTRLPTRRCSTCATTGGARASSRRCRRCSASCTCPIRASRTWPRA